VLIEIPELRGVRRVLAVQPHCDDNDLGAGGTLAALASAGAEVVYLTVSDDLLGVLDAQLPADAARARLRAEQSRAGREIGVARHYWLDLPDAGSWDHFALRRELVRHLRLERPDFVFAPDPWLPYEAHLDHVRTGRAVAEACLLSDARRLSSGDAALDRGFEPWELRGLVLYFTAAPNLHQPIGPTRARKHRAIDAYRSQLDEARLAVLHGVLEHKEREWGARCGAAHAEAFKVLAPAHLHCNPDAEEMLRSDAAAGLRRSPPD
jgi:N,N'-diacetylchitobiose non-reducing end deacetylase